VPIPPGLGKLYRPGHKFGSRDFGNDRSGCRVLMVSWNHAFLLCRFRQDLVVRHMLGNQPAWCVTLLRIFSSYNNTSCSAWTYTHGSTHASMLLTPGSTPVDSYMPAYHGCARTCIRCESWLHLAHGVNCTSKVSTSVYFPVGLPLAMYAKKMCTEPLHNIQHQSPRP
jgi:hypothetical protein